MTSAISNKFAALFGVEQADIDYMNQPANCASGSPYSTAVAGAFGRDLPFLMNVLNVGNSQVAENLFNGNEASMRLDYNLSSNNRLFGQFNWSKAADQFYGGNKTQLRGFYTPSITTTPNFQFSYIHTFTPTLLNEFRAGYVGNDLSFQASLPGVPDIEVDDGSVGFGSYAGYPQTFHENIYNYVDLVSLSHGKHSLKGGVEIRRNMENSNWDVGRPSYFFFDQLFFAVDQPWDEGAGIDPGFVSGQPARLEPSVRHFRNWEYGFFFQDDWKVSRRLTLNLGLRYDLYARHTELNNLATTFLKGPGQNLIDDIATGEGQIQSANVPCQDQRGILAGECGPGGFAPSKTLGQGTTMTSAPAWALPGMCWATARLRSAEASASPTRAPCITRFPTRAGTRPTFRWMRQPTRWGVEAATSCTVRWEEELPHSSDRLLRVSMLRREQRETFLAGTPLIPISQH